MPVAVQNGSPKRSTVSGSFVYLAAAVPARLVGSGITVALPVLAVQQIDDIGVGGLLVAAGLAPSVLVAPFVGVLLDRAKRPGLLIAAASAITALALVGAAFLGPVPAPIVVVLLVLAGCLTPFPMGGLSSIAPDIIDDERRAYGQDALAYNIAGVAGPGLVAVLLTIAPAQTAVFVLAALAALGAAAALLITLRRADRANQPAGVLTSIATGVRYLIRHRPLAVVTASGTLSQLGAGALPIAALSLTLSRTGDSEAGAWLVTAFSVGALAGSLAAATFAGTRVSPQSVMLGGFLATGVFTLLVLPDWGMVPALIVIALSGFASAPATAAMLLLRKQQSPDSVRSQVFTVGAGLRATAAAVGVALAGATLVGAETLFVLIGVCWIASSALLFAYPRRSSRVDGSEVDAQ